MPAKTKHQRTTRRLTPAKRARKLDEQTTRHQIRDDQATARALVEIVGKNRHLESLIVHNYCQRTNSYIVKAVDWERVSKGARHV